MPINKKDWAAIDKRISDTAKKLDADSQKALLSPTNLPFRLAVTGIIDAEVPAVSESVPGLCPTLSGDSTEFLNGVGDFSTPAGGGGSGTPAAHHATHETSGGDEVTPIVHHGRHEAGGLDPIKLDDLAAPDNNTDLNVGASHGLCPATPNDGSYLLGGTGTFRSKYGPDYVELQDEFVRSMLPGGKNYIGELGWYVTYSGTSGATTQIDSGQYHPGITRITTYTTLNHSAWMTLQYAYTSPYLHLYADDFKIMKTIIRPVDNTNVRILWGITDNSSSFPTNDSAYFKFDTTVDNFWHCTVSHGGVASDFTAATGITANNWYQLEIERAGAASWKFYLNGTMIKEWTVNCPTGVPVQIAYCLTTRANPGVKIMDIDYFYFKSINFGNRWT